MKIKVVDLEVPNLRIEVLEIGKDTIVESISPDLVVIHQSIDTRNIEGIIGQDQEMKRIDPDTLDMTEIGMTEERDLFQKKK